MRAVVQRVLSASVSIDGEKVAVIERGLMVLLGFAPEDDAETRAKMRQKLLKARVFADAQGRMNLSLQDTAGGLLLVPNFTLLADTKKGHRPGFSGAAPPAQAAEQFEAFCAEMRLEYPAVVQGRFGADMKVALVNDGPVTLLFELP